MKPAQFGRAACGRLLRRAADRLVRVVDKGGLGTTRGVERGIVRAEKEGPYLTRRVKAEPSGAASLCLSPIDAARAT